MHLGIGAFHRAHQAAYTEAALNAGDMRWGILGASLRSPDTRDALHVQNGLYALGVRDAQGEALSVIGAVRDVVVAPENPEKLIAVMARPATKIVSLTVTEKGYCHDPATGALREDHPDIVHDLVEHGRPKTALGFIVAALAMRRSAGVAPFTVLCCDNLPANGRTVKGVLSRFAHLRNAALGKYVADSLVCPSTMVDRIVPATSDEDRARIARALGATDAWPIVTEPFTQWVIEDTFAERPDWSLAGAQFVSDVAPYELMKLRLLNGAHSTLAYLGYLAGYQTVAAAMADAHLARVIRSMMDDEIAPTLKMPPGADLSGYKRALIERFRNPALKHRTWQIAMDGSQKLPQRLLGTVRDRLKAGAPFDRLALGIAGWMAYVTGRDEKGAAIDVRDPLAAALRQRADAAGRDAKALARALIGMEAIFGADLAADSRFVSTVTGALDTLLRLGARETLRRAGMAESNPGQH